MEETIQTTSVYLKEIVDLLINGECEIRSTTVNECIVHYIIVERGQYGKVCGSRGKMIKALKHLWEVCISRGINCPIRINLQEPSHGFASGRSAEVSPEKFDPDVYEKLIRLTINDLCNLDCDISRKQAGDKKDNSLHIFDLKIANPPNYLSDEFYDSFTSIFFAIAKANGGHVFLDWK